MRYVALGDSYTIGTSVPPAERWPERLVAAVGPPDAPWLELVANARGQRRHVGRSDPGPAAGP